MIFLQELLAGNFLTVRDFIYVVVIIVGAVATFFTTKHGLKDSFRDVNDKLTREMNDLKVQHESLKGRINLMECRIDTQQFSNREFTEGLLLRLKILEIKRQEKDERDE